MLLALQKGRRAVAVLVVLIASFIFLWGMGHFGFFAKDEEQSHNEVGETGATIAQIGSDIHSTDEIVRAHFTEDSPHIVSTERERSDPEPFTVLLSLPFDFVDIDEGSGVINPIGVVRFSMDRADSGHSGLDVPLFEGANITAVGNGPIVQIDTAGDPWGGKKIVQLLQHTSDGEGWVFVYEHVTPLPQLKVGENIQTGDVIAQKSAPEGFTAHFQLSHAFNDFNYLRGVLCWPEFLAATEQDALSRWWQTYRKLDHVRDSWNTILEEGKYPFRALLDPVSYPQGLELCYPLGTDVR